MKKILVTTDFSAASKAGLRFAIQLATQVDVELVFFHCFQAKIPITIEHQRIKDSLQEQKVYHLNMLERFVARLYTSMKVQGGAYHCVVLEYLDPEHAIVEYAHKNSFQFICMSTRGAGSILKLVGTHTGNIMQRSVVPVLAIPHTYRVGPIHKILYCSDLENFDQEIAIVTAFSNALKIKVDLVHFYFPGKISSNHESLIQLWRTKHPELGEIYLEPSDLGLGFRRQLTRLTQKIKPSLVVFFTHTHKGWFDKLFGASVSESVSFVTKVPMLVFRKGA